MLLFLWQVLASRIAWVDTKPVFLAATADWVLVFWEMEGETEGTAGPTGAIRRGARPPAGLALAGAAGGARPSSHPEDSKTCSHAPGSKRECFRDARGQDSSGRASSLARAEEPVPLPRRRDAQSPPPQPGSPGRRGARAADTAGTWARPQRCARHRLPARPNLGSPASGPAGGERDPPPFHFAPVRGNLRSVTRILKRATCSAGRAALGGIAGLGRRGLGTPGSGGHAGVGTPRRPAAAAR